MNPARRIQCWWHDSGWSDHEWKCVRVRVVIPEEMHRVGDGVLVLARPGLYRALLVCRCGKVDEWAVQGFRVGGKWLPHGWVIGSVEWSRNL